MIVDKSSKKNADRSASTLSPIGSLSLKRNFSWTFLGNAVYAISSWGMLVILAQLGNPVMVGQFALALAITAPLIMLTNLQLRIIQATDTLEEFCFEDYLALRLITTVIAFLTILVVVFFSSYKPETTLVIVVVGIGKSLDAISDVLYGSLQKRERMDYIAKSMIMNGLFSLAALGTTVYLSHSIVLGATAWATVSALNLVFYNIPITERFFKNSKERQAASGLSTNQYAIQLHFKPKSIAKLAKFSLPLGIGAALVSLNSNIPRYVLQHYYGEYQLGIFAALTYIQVGSTIVANALGQSASPRLASYYVSKRRKDFVLLLKRMLILGLVAGIGGILASLAIGKQILTILYGTKYSAYSDDFVWVVVGLLLCNLTSFLGYAITSVRKFQSQVIMHFIVTASTIAFSIALIQGHEITGAVLVRLLSLIVQLVLSMVIIFVTIKHLESSPSTNQSAEVVE